MSTQDLRFLYRQGQHTQIMRIQRYKLYREDYDRYTVPTYHCLNDLSILVWRAGKAKVPHWKLIK